MSAPRINPRRLRLATVDLLAGVGGGGAYTSSGFWPDGVRLEDYALVTWSTIERPHPTEDGPHPGPLERLDLRLFVSRLDLESLLLPNLLRRLDQARPLPPPVLKQGARYVSTIEVGGRRIARR